MDQKTRVLLAGVVGVGVVIGTAGLFLYKQLYDERRRVMQHQHQIHRLDKTVSELRAELVDLQAKQRSKPGGARRKRAATPASTDTESEYDMYSAVGTDDEDEEFFDLSDEDDDEDNNDSRVSSPPPLDPVLAQLFATCDLLMSGPTEDKRTAHAELLDHLEVYTECVGLLWRLAKSCSCMASVYESEGQLDKKKEVVTQGVNFAQRALDLDDDCAEAHKWYAILVGTRGEFCSTREKIEDGFVFKRHVDRALELTPRDHTLHHLLGRFKYEVAALSWIERKVASTLFAEPPTATFAEAIEHFELAERLSPAPWLENRLLLAKCYFAGGDYAAGVGWLDLAGEVEVKTPDDEIAQKEVESLSAKYDNYRL